MSILSQQTHTPDDRWSCQSWKHFRWRHCCWKHCWLSVVLCGGFATAWLTDDVHAQSVPILEQQLLAEEPAQLARIAREQGDSQRGAVLFYQPHMACTQCHIAKLGETQLGPDLTRLDPPPSDEKLVQSVLDPSREVRDEYRAWQVELKDGEVITGLLVRPGPDVDQSIGPMVLRTADNPALPITIARSDVSSAAELKTSIMPAGQVNGLASRQQFLDLIKYLIDIRDGGPIRAAELEPPPNLYAARPLPEYEQHVDHAGLLRNLNDESFQRGEAIYNQLCVNCHGTHDQMGSLPTSLRFAQGKFKNGNDPHTMYQTLTRGFGMMVPQGWMVPRQKYDVIHYIREAYLKSHNPSQYFAIDADYLANLPPGDTFGPEPVESSPWEQMDYGPNLVATYEFGEDGSNFAHKGNAIRLDAGPGGVSQGRYWSIFDYDTLRLAGAWSADQFIDWNGVNFNGRHGIHPRITKGVVYANPTGPGWADPATGSFADPRILGRDQRRYGPLPREWARYRGMYYHGADTVVEYTVGTTVIRELGAVELNADQPVYLRVLNLGPRDHELTMQVATHAGRSPHLTEALPVPAVDAQLTNSVVQFGPARHLRGATTVPDRRSVGEPFRLAGGSYVELGAADRFEMRDRDYTITARIKTAHDGTIFATTAPQAEWVPDGRTFFVRGGRLCFDIGWVGAVESRRSVADDDWHHVAAAYTAKSGTLQLFIDGQPDSQRVLKAKQPVHGHIARIGFTNANFPADSAFTGLIDAVHFFDRRLTADELSTFAKAEPAEARAIAAQHVRGLWRPMAAVASSTGNREVADESGQGPAGQIIAVEAAGNPRTSQLLAGVAGTKADVRWVSEGNNLRLRIPAGQQPLQLTVWITSFEESPHLVQNIADAVKSLPLEHPDRELDPLLHGGPARWPEKLVTQASVGASDGPFAIDVLTHPVQNPWLCRMRLTGIDFYPDGDRVVVTAWDGSVWLVSGLAGLLDAAPGSQVPLTWQRIASGLFQPLGVKIVDGLIYVTCRDQICILHDLNGDAEVDYYENFNNDHQVTEHFHEFAMGLQTDAAGNFYYAKSARHALEAVVPHHGTLLRVSADGARTDIVANGFRAANGVCLNPDGTFIVTDQEGHWNPKNRINWVREGGFYGNMFGYHDVTDSSDDAMEQPLCWITNAFDRSPSELLWVDSPAWGPLQGTLLNFSYGYGKVYVVPHEHLNGQAQGGMCELPIPQFTTGVMRGRFHPVDGQLYTCGMFAWAGNQTEPGGFYRIRYTGKPVHLPLGLRALREGITIEFSGELDRSMASDPSRYQVKVWDLKRTANYGSPHINEHSLEVTGVTVSDDRRSVNLDMPQLQPTWCMEIKYALSSEEGLPVIGTIHNTVHQLGDSSDTSK
ncbi:MAG: c-type cytochrome [Planctomycetales bacterium]|nr:c-type cytochrome [Planctomycetales bacterium]